MIVAATTAFALIGSAAIFATSSVGASADVTASAKQAVESPVVVKKPAKKARSAKAKAKETKVAAPSQASVVHALGHKVQALEAQVAGLQKQTEEAKSGTAWSKLYAYGPSLVTTPIVGKQRADGRDLIINSNFVNEDLWLLKLNRKVDRNYEKNNLKPFERPVVMVGGTVQGVVYNASRTNNDSANSIDVPVAALKVFVRANQWVNGLMLLEYDRTLRNLPIYAIPYGSGLGDANGGALRLRRAYITVGNLSKAPFYFSIGQMYVPFGAYYSASPSWRITDPQTVFLGRTEARPLVVGFSKCGAYGSLYAFKGQTYTNNGNSINQWGANLGYAYADQQWKFDVGAGYINNLADSQGMQNNLANYGTVVGFGTHKLQNAVPAANVHAMVTYKPVSLSVEYVGATRSFNALDMTFNNVGAKPQALDVSATYRFDVMGKSSFVGVAYDRTWQALALNLPKQSYVAVVGTSWFKNTEQKIEYRHDSNYDTTDAATMAAYSTSPVGSKQSDMIIGSFRIFF